MGTTLEDPGDDLAWFEGTGDVKRDLDELAEVLVWTFRQHTARKITKEKGGAL